MFVKAAAIFLLLGVCLALPVEETKPVEDVLISTSQPTPSEPSPVLVEALPEPPKSDDSDLKTDASSWWHSWYHYDYPSYRYKAHRPPHHVHWHAHW